GAGKTVLASIIVHHLRETLRLPENTGVAVIYLNHKENEIQSPSNLLASLWRQLVFRRVISMEVQQLYEKHREPRTRPSLADFHRILSSIVAEYSKVFLIVDALDEYPEDNRKILLNNLSNLGPNINLMLTSRPHINLSAAFNDSDTQTLKIRAKADDMGRYVIAQINKSEQLSKHLEVHPGLREQVASLCVARSDGMFLLAKLHIASLTTKHTVKAVREALKNMPNGLDSAYKEAIERINRQSEDDKMLAHSTIAWVSNEKRPLDVSELREVLAVEPGTKRLDPEDLLEIDVVLSVCAGLVIVDQTHTVRLIHYTVQHYLDHTKEMYFPTAQLDITRTCLIYLSFLVFADLGPDPVPRSTLMDLTGTHSLLNYAVKYGLIHAH
ncbi:hypothetical protein FB451DRAFT_1025328, partial [Mycena latifolia]